MFYKNTASQKFYLYAYTPADGLPKTGDAANITPYVGKDFGSATVLGTTTATEVDATNAPGYYTVGPTATETNADVLHVTAKSSTSGVKVLGAPAVIYTMPTTGVLSPATLGRTAVVDANGLIDANTVKIGPTGSGTAQTAKDLGSLNLSSGKVLIQGTIDQFDDFVTAAGKVTVGALDANVITAAATAADFGAEMATAIWTDTTAGDFTVALSVGKSVMNGVSLGTGLTVARCTLTDTLTTYTGNTVQTGDSFARIGATGSGLTTLATAAALATVQADTDDIQTRIPAALTANGNMKADVLRVNGTVQTAGDLAALINALQLYTTHVVARCTASGVPTTTSIPTSACSPSGSVADQFKGRIIIFDNDTTTAALRGQATDITASSAAATPTFTVTALTTAPASGDTFTIV